MKQILPTFLLVLSGVLSLFAQNTPPRILCGNEVFSHIVREKYPELQAAFDQTFEQAGRSNAAADRSPMNIKVVVHVVWNAAAENLADSIIENQIQILNEDFNRQNADTANLRPLFQPVAGNADIHFELVQIVRVQTSQLFSIDILGNSLLSELKFDSEGGSDAWDTEKYLNIWVCKIQPTTIFGLPVGQILGFAFPPNGLDNWPANSGAPSADEDGVVIDYRMMGRNNPHPLPNPAGGGNLLVRGRTPVHEVGHYLGLRHIWGDGGLLGPNNCAESDGVDDTPYANSQSEFNCDKTRNTCEQVEIFYNDDVPDLVENFMDYSSEDCMNMFTKGQVELMRNVLAGPRNGLLQSSSAPSPDETALHWRLSPNPTGGIFSVDFQTGQAERVAFRVLGADGRVVLQEVVREYPAGAHRRTFDLTQLAAGLYGVEITTTQGRSVKKILKVR
jgi:hypothetical protein